MNTRIANVLMCVAIPLASLLLVVAACSKQPEEAPAESPTAEPMAEVAIAAAAVDAQRIINADREPGNWMSHGRTYDEQRFSPLNTINDSNADRLGLSWYFDIPTDRGMQATPLMIDGVLYVSGAWSMVYAFDAASGELLWQYDPEVPREKLLELCCDAINRGVAAWEGKVFVGTLDGRLVALDAADGSVAWQAQTTPEGSAYSITGAPRVIKGKVIIGNGGSEFGVRGYISAYDAATGDLAWRFYTVPGDPSQPFENPILEMAAETWTGEWWKHGGGGNAWHGFTYDPEFNAVYIGTGNGSPWNRNIRSPGGGDNLFLCSVVALDADTGEYRWHYQTVPGETWDYNSNMDIVLADLKIGDRDVKALMHAPKNGFFYVIDRNTGELVSAEPFADVNWATHVDPESGRPVEVEGARYEDGVFKIVPGPWGAHSWHAMSYNPQTGLVYIPALHMKLGFNDQGIDRETFQSTPFRGGIGARLTWPEDQPRDYPASLLAWDPVTQSKAWEIPQDTFWNAGTLTTAGNLVFQGRADGQFIAYDARTGQQLWSFDAGLGISAPAITYKLNGTQYIALLVGFGGGFSALGGADAASLGWSYRAQTRRLITFSLKGEAAMPPQPPPRVPQPIEADFEVDAELAEAGNQLFNRDSIEGICWACHGMGAIAGGAAPDLRASSVVLDPKAFDRIVRGGALTQAGMPAFADLTDAELEGLRHYVRREAEAALAQ
jgi:quinohemoprotein ethanol dehydrogenase